MVTWEFYTGFGATNLWRMEAILSHNMSFWIVVDETKAEYLIMVGV